MGLACCLSTDVSWIVWVVRWFVLDVELKSVLVNVSQLVSQLSSNLSLPADSFNALVSAELNFTEVAQALSLTHS